jgi:hypothetical protein
MDVVPITPVPTTKNNYLYESKIPRFSITVSKTITTAYTINQSEALIARGDYDKAITLYKLLFKN